MLLELALQNIKSARLNKSSFTIPSELQQGGGMAGPGAPPTGMPPPGSMPAPGGMPAGPGGMMQDPQSGMLVDPQTGMLIDPQSGMMFDPQTGQPIDPNTGAPMPAEAPPQEAAPAEAGPQEQPLTYDGMISAFRQVLQEAGLGGKAPEAGPGGGDEEIKLPKEFEKRFTQLEAAVAELLEMSGQPPVGEEEAGGGAGFGAGAGMPAGPFAPGAEQAMMQIGGKKTASIASRLRMRK